ncbi:MAG TPA: methionyl-tRNA formyltransferase [Stellaceae bacterium]|nr:methionyl-tRNA formyltransferase [Stellaceae bacterium]
MTPLRLAFLGTPRFAERVLKALIASPHRIEAVYCQPPRPSGRGHKKLPSPVERAAEAAGLALRMPARLDDGEAAWLGALGLDAAVVAAYGLILPKAMLAAPLLGCLNVHASLLPRWRGAAPIERAIMAGDAETGVSIMQMDEGLDTGPVLLAEPVPIGPATTAAELHDTLAERGAALMLRALEGLAAGTLAPHPQPAEGATYARKIGREEGRLDWCLPAVALERRVRALNPSPGTWFEHGERIRLLAASVEPERAGAAPGTVLDDALTIACGEGALRPLILQRPGRAPVETKPFLRGFPVPPGTVLPCPASS